MACEAKRGCGFRKVGGIYLVAGGAWASCDRLPLEVFACPVCGEGVHFPRSPRKVDPKRLFGQHYELAGCTCPDTCQVCNPQEEVAYLLGVGAQYTPESFMLEAQAMGVSKRVPAVPKELVLGKTWVYLVHRKAIETGERDPETGKMKYKMAIFAAFVPKAVEMPVWESELTEERKAALEKRGITPVPVKDGDKDHAPVTRKKKTSKPVPEQAKLPLEGDGYLRIVEEG